MSTKLAVEHAETSHNMQKTEMIEPWFYIIPFH